jgi:hypothetical protein
VEELRHEGRHALLRIAVLLEVHQQVVGRVLTHDGSLEYLDVLYLGHSHEVLLLQPPQSLLQHLVVEVAEGAHLEQVLPLPHVVVVLQDHLQVYLSVLHALLVHQTLSDEPQQHDVRQGQIYLASNVLTNRFLAMILYWAENSE